MSSHKALVHRHLLKRPLAQRGYSLLELSAVLVIGSGMLFAMTMVTQSSNLQLRSQTMAKRYQVLMEGAVRYAKRYGAQLHAVSDTCSTPTLEWNPPAPTPKAVEQGACTVSLDTAHATVKVIHALQPTVAELKSLMVLDPQAITDIALDTVTKAHKAQKQPLAPAQLAVHLEKHCPDPSCATSSWLNVHVFNTQPYATTGGPAAFDRRNQVLGLFQALGDHAAIGSSLSADGMMVTALGRHQVSLPVRAFKNKNLEGLVVLRAQVWVAPLAPGLLSTTTPGPAEKSPLGNNNAQTSRFEGQVGAPIGLALPAVRANPLTTPIQAQGGRLDNDTLPDAAIAPSAPCEPERFNVGLDDSGRRILSCDRIKRTWGVAP